MCESASRNSVFDEILSTPLANCPWLCTRLFAVSAELAAEICPALCLDSGQAGHCLERAGTSEAVERQTPKSPQNVWMRAALFVANLQVAVFKPPTSSKKAASCSRFTFYPFTICLVVNVYIVYVYVYIIEDKSRNIQVYALKLPRRPTSGSALFM